MIKSANIVFTNYLAPELIYRVVKRNMDSTDQPQREQPGETATVSSSHAIDVTVPPKEPDVAVVSQGAVELASQPSTSVRRKSSRQRMRV